MSRPRLLTARTACALSGVLTTATAMTASGAADTPAELARSILDNQGIELLDSHVSGKEDPDPTASGNVEDTAAGNPAKTSPWSDVGVTDVEFSATVLDVMRQLGAEHEFRITTIAGGDHSNNSYHYAGTTFDLDVLDDEAISSGYPGYEAFLAQCEELGAAEALGPGYPGHDTHLHCAWAE